MNNEKTSTFPGVAAPGEAGTEIVHLCSRSKTSLICGEWSRFPASLLVFSPRWGQPYELPSLRGARPLPTPHLGCCLLPRRFSLHKVSCWWCWLHNSPSQGCVGSVIFLTKGVLCPMSPLAHCSGTPEGNRLRRAVTGRGWGREVRRARTGKSEVILRVWAVRCATWNSLLLLLHYVRALILFILVPLLLSSFLFLLQFLALRFYFGIHLSLFTCLFIYILFFLCSWARRTIISSWGLRSLDDNISSLYSIVVLNWQGVAEVHVAPCEMPCTNV